MSQTDDAGHGAIASSPAATAEPLPGVSDARVIAALEDYRAALEAGAKPDRKQFMARYPEVAGVLDECLDALEFVHLVTPQLHQPLGAQPVGLSRPGQSDAPGTPLGDYRILREIGRGGMGVVYEAEQLSLGRRVALKVLPLAATLDARQLQRFKNESLAAAHLHHTNIVPIISVGCERGVHFYAMQYIEGRTLADLIGDLQKTGQSGEHKKPNEASVASARAGKRENVETKEFPSCFPHSTIRILHSSDFCRTAANLGVQAALALEYAHQMGVVHRDIKPSNLLVDLRGNLWITDFGVAHFQKNPELTLTGDVLGTLRYMSPEQALARRTQVDHRTDLYSLGATLYELLTSAPVFDGFDRQELLRQIAVEEPRPPRQLNSAIPAELETIVLKLLAKNPEERYPAAQELADDLGRFLEDKPIKAKRPTLAQRTMKWLRRHKAVALMVAAFAAVLLVMALAGSLVSNTLITAQRDRALQAEQQARRRLYDSLFDQARASRWSGRIGQRFKSLEAIAEAAKLLPRLDLGADAVLGLRNEAIACLALPDLRLDREWQAYPPGIDLTGIGFDPNCEHYARVDDGNIVVRRLVDDEVIVRISDIGRPARHAPDWRLVLRFSPDGRLLAARGGGAPTQIWDLQGPKKLLQAEIATNWWDENMDFSPDSRLFATCLANGAIGIYEVRSSRHWKWIAPGARPASIRFHPDGRKLAVCQHSQVRICDLAGRQLMRPLLHPDDVASLSWSADGARLACGCNDQQAYIWEVGSDKPAVICKGHQTVVNHVAFNHQGDLLVTASWDGTTRLWDTWTGKGLLVTDGYGVDFSRDDRWLGLGFIGHRVGRWEVANNREFRSFHGHPRDKGISGVDIAAGGRLMASSGNDGVRLWDLAARQAVGGLPIGPTSSVIFDASRPVLVTSGPSGLCRWPIQAGFAPLAGGFRLGPPQIIPVPLGGAIERCALSGDGRTLIVCDRNWQAAILDLERPTDEGRRLSGGPLWFVDISPDARWAASGNWGGYECKVWDVPTAQCERKLPGGRTARVTFSPNNQWLAIATAQEYDLHEVGSPWRLHIQISRDYAGGLPGPIAFCKDSRLMALAHTRCLVKLVDPAAGQEIASLTAPDPVNLEWLCFSPDAGRLAAGTANGVIQVWDLHRIREHLRALGLDWEPPSAPTGAREEEGKPLQVEVDGGDLLARQKYSLILALFPCHAEAYYQRGLAHARFSDWQKAHDDFSHAVLWKPDHAGAFYQRGLIHSRCSRFREAVTDFSRALTVRPDDIDAYRSRGFAHGSLREWNNAVADWSKVIELNPEDPAAWFQRANAYEELGQWGQARADYQKFLELDAENSEVMNNLAWLLATCPETSVRDPGRAVDLAQRAVESRPKEASYWNTLGVAHYRAGNWEACIAALEKALDFRRGGQSYNWFFLAMAHWRKGDRDRASKEYDQAVDWMVRNKETLAKNRIWQEELARFRAETATLLGITSGR